MKRILVADDEQTLREGIVCALTERGWLVSEARDGAEALAKIQEEVFDLVLTDLQMPEVSGIDVLKRSKELNESTLALVMTAFGTVESAVEAMKAGAYDYVLKPFDLEELEIKVERAFEHHRLVARLEAYDRAAERQDSHGIVGVSGSMKAILKTVEKVAPSTATVLILGETGVGKELVAEAVHRSSSRAARPFVKMNCAALHENLMESEMFGHERGAYTGADRQRLGRLELANEGTLFLDEIGNMSLSTQAKLLRALQERAFERLGGNRTLKVDVRLVAATNRDLPQAIARNEFREDLYYRLNVVSLSIPALRDRKEDIVPLARHFLGRYAAELKKGVLGMEPGAVRALKRHNWPGNIRELQNAIERAVLMCEARYLTREDLSGALSNPGAAEAPQGLPVRLPAKGIRLDEVERLTLLEALRINNWIQADAARFLGITSRTMNYKVAKHAITHPHWNRNRAERQAPLADGTLEPLLRES